MSKLKKNCPVCKKGTLSIKGVAVEAANTKAWVYACSRCSFIEPVDDEEAALLANSSLTHAD